jgi:hypothetical protein
MIFLFLFIKCDKILIFCCKDWYSKLFEACVCPNGRLQVSLFLAFVHETVRGVSSGRGPAISAQVHGRVRASLANVSRGVLGVSGGADALYYWRSCEL